LDKSSGIHYQLIAITIGLILFAGSISGSASIAYADDDDKKEKSKKFIELLKKFRDRQNDDSHDDSKKNGKECNRKKDTNEDVPH